MIEHKVITTGKKEYESIYYYNTYQECDDCGNRRYAKYPIRVRIKHKFPLYAPIRLQDTRIPIDNNHYVGLSLGRCDLIFSKSNILIDATSQVPTMRDSVQKLECNKKWEGRNALEMQLFSGLGTESVDECPECYDSEYQDEYGDNNVGTELTSASMFMCIYSHLHNTIELGGRIKIQQGIFGDISRDIIYSDDTVTIKIADITIEIDTVEEDSFVKDIDIQKIPRYVLNPENTYEYLFYNTRHHPPYSFKRFIEPNTVY